MHWQTHDIGRYKNPAVCLSMCQVDKNQAQLCLNELGTTRPGEVLFSVKCLRLSFGSSAVIHPDTCVAVLGCSSAHAHHSAVEGTRCFGSIVTSKPLPTCFKFLVQKVCSHMGACDKWLSLSLHAWNVELNYIEQALSEVHCLLQLWCAQGQPVYSCPVWSQLLWP